MTKQVAIVPYGIKWNGPREPIGTPMDDGYWTPWHIANAEVERLRALLAEPNYCARCGANENEPSDDRILPCDVTVGNTTIKAGLPVSTVLKSIKVHAEARVAFSGPSTKALDGGQLCEDCPPVGYPTDKTRCDECPRHT